MASASPAGFDLETVDRLLGTTRAVRRRLDLRRPVEPAVLRECVRLSQQAPTAGNHQGWRWVIVRDAEKRKRLAEIYAKGKPGIEAGRKAATDDQTRRVYDGALWLADHLAEVPVHVIPCLEAAPPERFDACLYASLYGSVIQAVWSFQLALRSRGLGSVYTTLHLICEAEARAVLGIPEGVMQMGLLPVAYTVGTDFKVAARPPVEEIAFWDQWGEAQG